jgi:hypothetical protein
MEPTKQADQHRPLPAKLIDGDLPLAGDCVKYNVGRAIARLQGPIGEAVRHVILLLAAPPVQMILGNDAPALLIEAISFAAGDAPERNGLPTAVVSMMLNLYEAVFARHHALFLSFQIR